MFVPFSLWSLHRVAKTKIQMGYRAPVCNILMFDLLTNINKKRLSLQIDQMQYKKFTMMSPEENVGSNEAFQAFLKLVLTNHASKRISQVLWNNK